MELLHRRALAAVKEEGGKIVNPEIIPAYSAYQEVIDLTATHTIHKEAAITIAFI